VCMCVCMCVWVCERDEHASSHSPTHRQAFLRIRFTDWVLALHTRPAPPPCTHVRTHAHTPAHICVHTPMAIGTHTHTLMYIHVCMCADRMLALHGVQAQGRQNRRGLMPRPIRNVEFVTRSNLELRTR